MRLEPVYLIAPEPEPKQRLISRRLFVFGLSGSAAAGFGIGWASSRGRESPTPDPAAASPAAVPASADDRQRWALLLQEGPVEDLVENYQAFLWIAGTPVDARMEIGVRRLCEAILEGSVTDVQVQQDLASSLTLTIERLHAQHPLARYARRLRAFKPR